MDDEPEFCARFLIQLRLRIQTLPWCACCCSPQEQLLESDPNGRVSQVSVPLPAMMTIDRP